MTYAIAYAKNREDAFTESNADVVITNHDAVKWIAMNYHVLCGFDTLVIDEFTAFKNKDSQRSESMPQSCGSIYSPYRNVWYAKQQRHPRCVASNA